MMDLVCEELPNLRRVATIDYIIPLLARGCFHSRSLHHENCREGGGGEERSAVTIMARVLACQHGAEVQISRMANLANY